MTFKKTTAPLATMGLCFFAFVIGEDSLYVQVLHGMKQMILHTCSGSKENRKTVWRVERPTPGA